MSTREERLRRRFSEEIKREMVKRIDRGEQTITSVGRELEVSLTAIYRWMSKYSVNYQKKHRVVVEKKSYEGRVKQLEAELNDLQAALGRKQMKIDYLEKLIEIAESEQGVAIRKKAERQPWNGSETRDQPIRGR